MTPESLVNLGHISLQSPSSSHHMTKHGHLQGHIGHHRPQLIEEVIHGGEHRESEGEGEDSMGDEGEHGWLGSVERNAPHFQTEVSHEVIPNFPALNGCMDRHGDAKNGENKQKEDHFPHFGCAFPPCQKQERGDPKEAADDG